MSKPLKRTISLILISVLCLHFGFLVIYTSPFKITGSKIGFMTKAWVNPFFHQNWSLFVPAPKSPHYLFVRYKNESNQVEWKDILRDCVENNQQNRCKGNEAITLLFSNSLVYLLNKVPESTLYKQVPDFTEFNVLRYELSHYLALHHILTKGQAYEIIVYSREPGHHKTLYFQSLLFK